MPGKGGQICRGAGTGAQLMAKEGDYVTLKLPSSEMRMVRRDCYATIGVLGNIDHKNQKLGKAGRKRVEEKYDWDFLYEKHYRKLFS